MDWGDAVRLANAIVAFVAFVLWVASAGARWDELSLRHRLICLTELVALYMFMHGSYNSAVEDRPVTLVTWLITVTCLLSIASQLVPGGFVREWFKQRKEDHE